MGKRSKTIFLLSLIMCLLCGNTTVFASSGDFIISSGNRIEVVSDVPMSTALNPSLTACNVGIGIADNGLLMTFDTTATHSADEIGVKDIILREKTLFGWNKIELPQEKYCTYNSDWYSIDIVYTGAVEGKTYYIECTHYAIFDGKEITLGNYTGELTYN